MPGIELSKCVFITGGTSGIGRALGYKIKDLPTKPQVIMSGRRQDRLDELAKDGFQTLRMDVDIDRALLKKEAEQLLAKYPDANTIILNAGVERRTDFRKEVDLDRIEEEMRVNYLSVVTLISVFLPHLMKRGSQGRPVFLITVTSVLAIFPTPQLSCYSATKAALRSLTLSLRAQLAGTGISIIEILPPLVESELHHEDGLEAAFSQAWMPLDEYIAATMKSLIAGETDIYAASSEEVWNRFEKGKDQFVQRLNQFLG